MKIKVLLMTILSVAILSSGSTIPDEIIEINYEYNRIDDKPAPDGPDAQRQKEILQRLERLERLLQWIKQALDALLKK